MILYQNLKKPYYICTLTAVFFSPYGIGSAFGLRGYLARSARRLPPSHLRVIYEPSTNHLRRVKGFLTPSLDFARDKSFNCSIFPVITATWLLSFDGLSSRLSKHFAKHQRHRLSKPPFSFLTNREVAFHVGKLLLS